MTHMMTSFCRGSSAIILVIIASTGCTESRAAGASAPPPSTQYVVGIDISGSRTPKQLEDAENVLTALVGRMQFGDRLVLIETYQTNNDSAAQWESTAPEPRHQQPTGGDRKRLEQFRTVTAALIPTFFDPKRAVSVKSTDIMATLFRGAEYAKARPGEPTMVLLLSDMLNSTRELNMEKRGGIPDSRWIAGRKAEGRLPDLRGTCVFVVGADLASARGAAARRFWGEYFRAAGAAFDVSDYRGHVSDARELVCR
jgi:hypothetical protein